MSQQKSVQPERILEHDADKNDERKLALQAEIAVNFFDLLGRMYRNAESISEREYEIRIKPVQ